MEHNVREVYSLMIPIIEQSILLPNATVEEIVPFRDVTLTDTGPNWYVGDLHWQGSLVPLVSLDVMNGGEDPQANKQARVAVVTTLNNSEQVPYVAFIVQGIPRLTHVTEPSISLDDDGEEMGLADKAKVKIGSIRAMIPDIDKIESMVADIKAA
ncbi:MAG: chemotaxis protein CheW [Kangiellaceae bacterium]|jgi:chemosensory pili system protein ChpC|nr:chemotaxis protein CheW [Kangiellaceae bacterium]